MKFLDAAIRGELYYKWEWAIHDFGIHCIPIDFVSDNLFEVVHLTEIRWNVRDVSIKGLSSKIGAFSEL